MAAASGATHTHNSAPEPGGEEEVDRQARMRNGGGRCNDFFGAPLGMCAGLLRPSPPSRSVLRDVHAHFHQFSSTL